MCKRFCNWSIFNKIMSISFVSAILLVLAVTFLLTPFVRNLIMKEKEHTLTTNLQQATSLLGSYQKQVEAGTLPLDEAKRLASQQIAAVRYDGSNYIWIQDTDLKMVMHPIKPEINGKDLSQEKDPNGTYLFVEMNKACKDNGTGCVKYSWPKPGSAAPVPKLSCSELFKPWGWVLGTGIYIDDVTAQMRTIQFGIGVALLVMLSITLLLAYGISRSITVPVATLVKQTDLIANGDLRVEILLCSEDEIGRLACALKTMTTNLRSIIGRVADTSGQVAAAAIQVNAASERIATGSEEVAAQTVTVATASEEMAATSGDIAHNCQLAAEGAQQATNSARNGATVVKATVAVMSQIADRVQESARTVESLGTRSDQIGAIIGTIEDIADQTNLLALNAAIEAARAGEQGRGFAVVADEVRALAERTTQATKEIGEMIKAIQTETKGAVAAMEQGVHQVEAGTIEADKSGEALKDILDQINNVAMQVNQIATAAEEQTATTSEITNNIQQVTEVVQETAKGAGESASAACKLNSNAEELQRLVRQFKL